MLVLSVNEYIEMHDHQNIKKIFSTFAEKLFLVASFFIYN